MAQLNFDCRTVEPAGSGGGMLPVSPAEGWPVIISASELKENAAKSGGYLELTLQIIEGEMKGQEGSYRLNLFHTNPKTVEIAYKQLSAIGYVTNTFQIADSAQLHNKPFRAVVALQKVKEGDENKGYTEVRAVKDIAGNDPGKTGATAAPAPAAPPVAPPAPTFAAPAAPAAPAQPAWGNAEVPMPVTTPPNPPAWGTPPAATGAAAQPPWATKP